VTAGLVQVSGRPAVHDLRAMVDAVFYVVRNGVEWRTLPADFPPHAAVYRFFERWSRRGLPETAGAPASRTAGRAPGPQRRAEGRDR
jgi:hypothetical protein